MSRPPSGFRFDPRPLDPQRATPENDPSMNRLDPSAEANPLLALHVSDDLTADERTVVEQELRYDPAARRRKEALAASHQLLREAAATPTPTAGRPSLWARIEPRLGPAGRNRRRVWPWLSTGPLAAACAALLVLVVWNETASETPDPRPAVAVAPAASAAREVSAQDAARVRRRRTPPTRQVGLDRGAADVAASLPVFGPGDDVLRLGRMGLEVRPLTDGLRRRLRLPRCLAGVVVGAVAEGSPAYFAGLLPGDVVRQVGGRNTDALDGFARAVRLAPAGEELSLWLQVYRQGRLLPLQMKLWDMRDVPAAEAGDDPKLSLNRDPAWRPSRV